MKKKIWLPVKQTCPKCGQKYVKGETYRIEGNQCSFCGNYLKKGLLN
jgi:ribosomal protein L37AE/L43A